jgi:hypothetical protein
MEILPHFPVLVQLFRRAKIHTFVLLSLNFGSLQNSFLFDQQLSKDNEEVRYGRGAGSFCKLGKLRERLGLLNCNV